MQPELRNVATKYAAGISVSTTNMNEFTPGLGKIPGLWARFFGEDLYNSIPNRTQDGVPVGVYVDFEDGYSGTFTVLAGVATNDLSAVPDGMRGITLAAGRYLVFTSKGAMPAAVIAAWTAIWQYFQTSQEYRRAFKTDYEWYVAPDEVEIHISID